MDWCHREVLWCPKWLMAAAGATSMPTAVQSNLSPSFLLFLEEKREYPSRVFSGCWTDRVSVGQKEEKQSGRTDPTFGPYLSAGQQKGDRWDWGVLINRQRRITYASALINTSSSTRPCWARRKYLLATIYLFIPTDIRCVYVCVSQALRVSTTTRRPIYF